MNTSTTSVPSLSDAERTLLGLPNVAIIGRAGAGKTSAAKFVESNYKCAHASFAALLKEVAVLIWGPAAERDRGKLQELGKKVREIDPDAWLCALERRIEGWRQPIVIDDCRFPNEYWALKHRGFKFIRVIADEAIREDRLLRNGKLQRHEQLNDESETSLDDIRVEFHVYNNADFDSFYAQVYECIERFKRQVL